MENIKHNELTFHLMVEASPNALILVNSKGKITYLNSFTENLFQHKKTELIGKNIETLIPVKFKNEHSSFMQSYLQNPVRRQMGANRELFAIKKDGTEFPVEIGLNPIITVDGILTLAAIIDITERKQTEKQFRLVVESAPNAMILVNHSGEIKMANKQAEKQFGYKNNELIGTKLETLIPHRYQKKHPDYRNNFMHSPETRAMGIGRDLFALRKDGTEFPAEIGLNPIEMTDEKLILASIIDITERKKYENKILLSKQKLEELSEKLYLNNIELEKKNNDVNESIQYAKKIQYSILPELNYINKYLSDVVLFYEPRNVISGDFYWFYNKENINFIAAVDCTGHGVPGALMSMAVHSLLKEIILFDINANTGNILSNLHSRLYKYLQQNKGDKYSQDGCDISLCKIDTKNKQLQFSGARQDLYLYDENKISIIKSTKKSIGGLSLLNKTEPERSFNTENIKLNENMYFSILTDGILDQLNENNDIFSTNRFLEMFIKSCNLPQNEKYNYIRNEINNWKENTDQQDDMLMITFKTKI